MIYDNELFDRAVKLHGPAGRLDDDSPIRSRPIFGYSKFTADKIIGGFRNTSIKTKPLPKVIVDYIDSPVSTAFASYCEDGYIIAISYGLVLTLEIMMYRLFSSNKLLLDFGNVSLENNDLPEITIDIDFDLIDSELKTRGLTIDDYRPIDQSRSTAATYFLQQALIFIMGHEFRHIQAGHCDYYKNKFQLHIFNESVAKSFKPQVTMKQQAMEWDADAFSINSIVMHSMQSLRLAKRSEELGTRVFAEVYSDPDRFLALATIACYAFFKLLDLDEPPLSMWEYRSHPPTRLRRLWLVTDALEAAHAIDESIFSSQSASNVNKQLVDHYDPILNSIWGLPDDSATPPLDKKAADTHELKTFRSFRSIIPDLRKYSFVPIPSV